MALTNPKPKSVIICQTQEIISELKKRDHIILLQWVPAHVGVDYNERVDELVKQGRDKSSEISTAELADVCALVKTKVESSTPKKFDCQPVMKLNTSRETYSAIVRLRSKRTLGFRFLQDGQRSYPQYNRCQNVTLKPEHAFSSNIAKKVKNFGFMTLEEALKADPVATAKFIIEQHGRV